MVVRHFYHYAGWAQLMEEEMKGWKPLGELGDAGVLAGGPLPLQPGPGGFKGGQMCGFTLTLT